MFSSVKFTNLNHHHGDFNEKLSQELSKLSITETPQNLQPMSSNTITPSKYNKYIYGNMNQQAMTDDGALEHYDWNIDYKTKYQAVQHEKNRLQALVEQLQAQNDKLKQNIDKLQHQYQRTYRENKFRRPFYQEKLYECKFPNCSRAYGSDVSVNLHMKLKHNYGSKAQREIYALEIIKSEKEGNLEQVLSRNTVVFLPGQIDEYRERLRAV